MTDFTEESDSTAQNGSQQKIMNNTDDDDDDKPSSPKRPRIDYISQEDNSNDLERVVSNNETAITADAMVIDITTPSRPTAGDRNNNNNNDNNTVQIKKDPGAATGDGDHPDDSDMEIISPSKLKKPRYHNLEGSNNDDDDDDIKITSSTLTQPNVDYPHLRSNCGVHKFRTDNHHSDNVKFCPQCFCFVCDVPASECNEWSNTKNTMGPHCHAHNGDEKWTSLVKEKRDAATATATRQQEQPNQARINTSVDSSSNHQQIAQLIHNEFLSRLATDNNNDTANNANNNREDQRTKARKEMRITEVLAENFQKVLKIHEENNNGNTVDLTSPTAAAAAGTRNKYLSEAASSNSSKKLSSITTRSKMEGDIPTLSLTNFFVMGIKIGWPYPTVMAPQRQMAFHIIKALNSSKHVVLESPTGTGKSAAILCSVLAWQRHHWKKNGGEGNQEEKVRIIYCSRTHSQVAQMVASLKQTPYRPRMAILGSRERLCIHQSIKPRGDTAAEEVKGVVNVNNECRMRVRNTEKSRKKQLSNPWNGIYDDDDPPDGRGDGDMGQEQQQGEEIDDEGGESEENSFLSRSKTCPHYRQLTTSRVVNLVHSTFVPSKGVDCCSVGGSKSKYGAHDIEDLVKFGVNPYMQRDIALYRRDPTDSLGLTLQDGAGNKRGCFIRTVKRDTPASMNGSLNVGDRIVRVNGNDVFDSDMENVYTRIKGIKNDPVVLDVTRGGSGSLSMSDGSYSPHAACPYYVSQMLSKDAEIIFAPYNYVLDPGIREAMGIELENSVVVLDEAHNVETVLRDAGSGKFGEIELCDLIVMLNNYALTSKTAGNMLELEEEGGVTDSAHLCEVAHTLLLFVEKIVIKLREDKAIFEGNPGKKGADQALRDWERFHTSDDTEFDITFDGPTGYGKMGKAVGCRPFFDKLGLTESDFQKLCVHADAFEKFLRGRDDNNATTERDRISNLVDKLLELIGKMNSAISESCHYYVAICAISNGSLEFAANGEVDSDGPARRFRRKPKPMPLIPPRTPVHPDRPAYPCQNQYCKAKSTDAFNPIRHGDYCDGSTPRWEAFLCLELLTPGPLMQQLANECRTVVLASGSLAPIPSLCAELNLFPADGPPDTKSSPSPMKPSPSSPSKIIQKRLQDKPSPLEAGHVINLDKQLRCISIGHFPDGSELKVSHANYKHEEFLKKLGDSLVRIIEGIPEGGVLVFFPSYALLKKCERLWNPGSYKTYRGASFRMSQHGRDYPDETSVWSRLKAAKHNVVVESSGSQDEFEERKAEYMDSVKRLGGCVLLAVYRGKMSEGISFNDNNARGVICIGLPLPNSFALPVKVKMDYNDEQRKIQNKTYLLPGREWYNQQAYRAIAQALGRCIRHIADYGAIFLLDIRHCDDGSPNNGCPSAHIKLPKWMRSSVRNLSRNSSTGRSPMFQYASSNTEILGGWNGLKPELHRFFREAKPYVADILSKSQEKIAASKSCPSSVGSSDSARGVKNMQSNVAASRSTAPPSAEKNSSHQYASSTQTRPSTVRQPSVPSQASSTPSSTLQAMFQKQKDMATTNESTRKPPSVPKTKKPNNAMNLITMFEKQRAALTQQEASRGDSAGEDESAKKVTAPGAEFAEHAKENTQGNAEATVVPAGVASPTVVPQQQKSQPSQIEDEERLCVVCEDAKKEIIILPCKHMCLCTKCANFELIKECPMCRGKVEDSMTVYW